MRHGWLWVVLVAVLVLAGCTGQGTDDLPTDDTPQPNATDRETVFALNETVGIETRSGGRFNVTLLDYRLTRTYSHGSGAASAAGSGERYLFLKLRVRNTGNASATPPDVTPNSSLRQPLDAERAAWMEHGWYTTDTLAPGATRTGWKLYVVTDATTADDVVVFLQDGLVVRDHHWTLD